MSPVRRVLAFVGLLGLVGAAITVAGPTTSGIAGSASAVRPVIGKPTTVPAKPVAGKSFMVSFRVTRSDTGAPLVRGSMVCAPSVAGKLVRHTESFKAGTARLVFVVPANAMLLKVKLTIKAAGRSATKITTFRVQQVAKPSLSVADASVAEGNSGATTLSFPVTLSAASTQTVSVSYATVDGTATAGNDYVAPSGTLTFKPGEKAKAVSVTVKSDTAVEPDETLTVTLSSPVNATIADGTATGTIKNDDVAPRSGHYAGTTSQGKAISFDVATDLTSLNNLTATIDQTCNLPGLDMTDLTFPLASAPIAPDWSFGVNLPVSTSDMSLNVTFSGKLSLPGNATGTLRVDMSMYNLPIFGTVSCSTGDVTWNAS